MENEVNPERNEQFSDGKDKERGIKEILFHSKKITEALYRVTELFPNKEPLKWLLRSESVKILELIVSLETSSFEKKILYFDKISKIINKIIHILDIASLNSYIASINLGIIKREYEKMESFILNNKDLYFEIPEISALKSNTENLNFIGQNNGQINNGIKTHMSIMSDMIVKEKKDKNNEITYKVNSVKESNKVKENSSSVSLSPFFEDYNKRISVKDTDIEFSERAKKIIEIINEKETKSIAINDVFKHFNNVSKKTVQRELAKLVHKGFLKMDGEKRWRIYSVK